MMDAHMTGPADESLNVLQDRFRGGLLLGFAGLGAASCINGEHPFDFFLQHLLTAAVVAALAWQGRRLSRLSFALVVMFMCLHLVGARYFYSYVPYDEWSQALFGFYISSALGFERNHYDRLVHFAYGLLLFLPARELNAQALGVRGWRASYIALLLVMSTSAVYELVEVLVALMLSPETAERYNGQQGDVFDAQKDAALAALGAMLSCAGFAIFDRLRGPRRAKAR